MYIFAHIIVYTLIILLAWAITAWMRQYALRKEILDHPNHRSAHAVPTPTGGGISIVLIFMLGSLSLWISDHLSTQLFLAIGIGGILVAAVGWMDDKYDVPIVWRAILYLLAVAWAVYWVAGIAPTSGIYPMLTYSLIVLAVAWLVNLYNFMDGTDGLAAIETIYIALITAILLFLSGQTGLSALLLILSASCIGFLIWNWPPARIFMGDTGSCLIGFVIGVSAYTSSSSDILPLSIWLILLSVFICDATLTLMKRILNREKWYMAHRSHAYQLIVHAGYTHKQLLIAVVVFNVLVLLPLAITVYYAPLWQWWLASAAWIITGSAWVMIQLKYRQGMDKQHEKNAAIVK